MSVGKPMIASTRSFSSTYRRISLSPDPAPPVTTPGTYPTATATDNPMEVISPYHPYNVIDLSDLPDPGSGQLARDPSNKQIFRIP